MSNQLFSNANYDWVYNNIFRFCWILFERKQIICFGMPSMILPYCDFIDPLLIPY